MDKPIKIIGICGSLRERSFNKMVLKAATGVVPEGAILEPFFLHGIPIFNQDNDQDPPESVKEFKAAIRAADAILFVSPEYNNSVPGVLKNAIDWASRPNGDSAWSGKPVAVMGASPGLFGTVRMQIHLKQIFNSLNMFPVSQPEVMIGKAGQRFDGNGNLTDEITREHIRGLLKALVDWTRRLGG